MHGCKLRIESNIIERNMGLFDWRHERFRDGRKWNGMDGIGMGKIRIRAWGIYFETGVKVKVFYCKNGN